MVLNWNNAEATESCIKAVDIAFERLPEKHLLKILVDNGSSLKQRDLARRIVGGSDWVFIANADNLGFAKGMNTGWLQGHAADCDWVLFLNNDARLHTEAACALHQHILAQPEQRLIGLVIKAPNENETRPVFGYKYQSWFGAARPVTQPNTHVDYVSGAAFLCSGRLLRASKGIPDNSFMYFEELRLADLINRRSELGVCLNAYVEHVEDSTLSKQTVHPSRHYFAAISCFRYTSDTAPYKLPTVIMTRLGWLTLQSINQRSPCPLSGGLMALHDFILKRERLPQKSP